MKKVDVDICEKHRNCSKLLGMRGGLSIMLTISLFGSSQTGLIEFVVAGVGDYTRETQFAAE